MSYLLLFVTNFNYFINLVEKNYLVKKLKFKD